MASHCRTILGDAVLADPLETHPVRGNFIRKRKHGKARWSFACKTALNVHPTDQIWSQLHKLLFVKFLHCTQSSGLCWTPLAKTNNFRLRVSKQQCRKPQVQYKCLYAGCLRGVLHRSCVLWNLVPNKFSNLTLAKPWDLECKTTCVPKSHTTLVWRFQIAPYRSSGHFSAPVRVV